MKEIICLCNQAAEWAFLESPRSEPEESDVGRGMRVMKWEKQTRFKPCSILSSSYIILLVAGRLFSDRPRSLTCFRTNSKETVLLCHSMTSFDLLHAAEGCIGLLVGPKTVKSLWPTVPQTSQRTRDLAFSFLFVIVKNRSNLLVTMLHQRDRWASLSPSLCTSFSSVVFYMCDRICVSCLNFPEGTRSFCSRVRGSS